MLQTIKVMCCRKTENQEYTLSNYNTFYLLLKSLQKKYNTKEIWIVEIGGSTEKKYDENVNTYNIFSFNHFGEILDILKPDIVISIGGDYEYLERSMLMAASKKGIPSVDITSTVIEQGYFKKEYSRSIVSGRIRAILDHGKNIIRKYFFLLKTLYYTNYNFLYIIKTIIKDIYLPFTTFVPRYNFGGGSINLVSTPSWIDFLEKKGIDKNKIIVTGECSMDPLYYKIFDIEKGINNYEIDNTNKLLEILIITSPMVEHGYWKPSMRDEVISRVIQSIRENFDKNTVIKIKIHPVTETIETYSNIIRNFDYDIKIIQKADLLSLIKTADLIIGFGVTSAYFQAILLKKPVILINLFDEELEKNIYLREKLVAECKDISELTELINKRNNFVNTDEVINRVIEKVFYKFDGKCSERAADSIISILEKRTNA